MFERFTERARRVVMLAQNQARELKYHHIGTEHLVLGMIEEGEGVAGQVLTDLGIRLEVATERVLALVKPEDEESNSHIPFTPRAKKALESALREALQLGHNYIGTEHIILGVLRVGEGAGVQILESFTDAQTIRQGVILKLSGEKPEKVTTKVNEDEFIAMLEVESAARMRLQYLAREGLVDISLRDALALLDKARA